MNICKRCGKENQEHYKFCLGCGGELTSSAAPAVGGGPQKTIMAGALGGPLGGAAPSGLSGPGPAPGPTIGGPRVASPTPPGGMAALPGSGPLGPSHGPGPGSPLGGSPPPLGPPPLGPPPQLGGQPGALGGSSLGGHGGHGGHGGLGGGYGQPPFPPPGSGPVAQPEPARTVMAGQGGLPTPAGWPGAAQQQPPQPSGFPPSTPPPGGSPFGGPPFSPQPYNPSPQPYSSPPTGSPPFTPVNAPSFTPPSPSGATPGQMPLSQSASHAAIATRACHNCGTEVPVSFVFCGACGARLADAPQGGLSQPPLGTRQTGDLGMPIGGPRVAPMPVAPMPVAEPKPHGRLTLIRPDGSEGGTHELDEGDNQIGRQHGSLFENDGYLSPRHAEIVVSATGAVIRDAGSLNGVFCKMTQEEELGAGDVFRIGQELLRYDLVPSPQPLEDGTEVMGSPNPGYWGRVSVMIGKDIDGSAYPLFGDAVTIGRERGDINFPDDGYVSGLHARVSYRDGKAFLADLGSSNGTFIRLRGERTVQDGAFILFGQQLFRVNLMMV